MNKALQSIIEKFEHLAHTEPDTDFRLRDEFCDYDENDEKAIERADQKLEDYLAKLYKHEKARGRLRRAVDYDHVDDFDNDEVNQTIMEKQREAFDETLSVVNGNNTAYKVGSTTDGAVCREFINRMHQMNTVQGGKEADADSTFLVGKMADMNSTCDITIVEHTDPMYAHQMTLTAHAMNKISARIRRKHSHLHQGSFNQSQPIDESGNKSDAFELTASHVNDMYQQGTILYSSDSDDSSVENDVDCGTYINIDNFSRGETMMNGTTKRLPKIDFDARGNPMKTGHLTKKRKSDIRTIIEESDLAENFEQLNVDRRRSSTFLTPKSRHVRGIMPPPPSPQQILEEYETQQNNATMNQLTPSQRRRRGMRRTRPRNDDFINASMAAILASPNVKGRQRQRQILGDFN